MRPACGFAQPFANGCIFALHQKAFPIGAGHLWLNACDAAARVVFKIDAPFFGEDINIQSPRRALVR